MFVPCIVYRLSEIRALNALHSTHSRETPNRNTNTTKLAPASRLCRLRAFLYIISVFWPRLDTSFTVTTNQIHTT